METNGFLEECHNWIQWVFPTKTVSQYCENAPVLTEEIAKVLKEKHLFQMEAAFRRFLSFLDSRNMNEFNHNHLRITRVIESFTLVAGNMFPLITFFELCQNYLPVTQTTDVYKTCRIPYFDKNTFSYWAKALEAKF